MTEIEYKFLVNTDKWEQVKKPEPVRIVQGFIHREPECVVRVRIKGEKGYLTIKGKSEGIRRTEFEYEIPLDEAEAMLKQFTDRYIDKFRYHIEVGNHTWEVDVFHGKLNGLILAELEVESEEEAFVRPDWVTEDVSTNPEYFNAVLIERC